jgi:DNA-binding NtrC family response regulator
MSRGTVLVVEDDAEMRQLLDDELRDAGFDVLLAGSAGEALRMIQGVTPDIVVSDLIMPGMKGDELLVKLRSLEPNLPVVIMTAFGSIESAVEAMRQGAYHYIAKPFRMEELLGTLEAALEERRIREGLAAEAPEVPLPAGVVAESPGMKRVLSLLSRAARVDSAVLIRGESGTGKELLARALHAGGARQKGPFVAVNCSAIPEALLESQLFGHRRGAFTDAREDQTGLFQQAEGGTLFLDEIGDMPPALQAKLLRVLQEREIRPLGATSSIAVDVRVVAATHRDLEAMCASGQFRQDLYYRLNVITLRIPPLRERPSDIVPLVAHFLDKHASRMGRAGLTVSREAMDSLRAHSWPGNVRELENVIERAVVLGQNPVIAPSDLSEGMTHPATDIVTDVRSLSAVEREEIIRALRSVSGNKTAAARLLGLDRKTLYRKIELYGLQEL